MATFKSGTTHKAEINAFIRLPPEMRRWEHRWRMYLEDCSGRVKKIADKKVLLLEGENKPVLECKMPKVKKETEYKVIFLRGDGLFLLGRWYIGRPECFYQGIEKVTLLPEN